MNIRSLIEALLLHDDFWAPASRYALVRSPIEFVVATLRRTGYRFAPNSAEGRNYLDPMGQIPFEPPNVAGWGVNGYWLSTATAWARGNFASWMRWKVGDGANQLPILPELKAGSNGRVALTATAAITLLFDRLGIVEPSPATRARARGVVHGREHQLERLVHPGQRADARACSPPTSNSPELETLRPETMRRH